MFFLLPVVFFLLFVYSIKAKHHRPDKINFFLGLFNALQSSVHFQCCFVRSSCIPKSFKNTVLSHSAFQKNTDTCVVHQEIKEYDDKQNAYITKQHELFCVSGS